MFVRLICVTLALVALLEQPLFAQRDLQNIPSPDPAEELATFQIADGLEVNLFAADPAIHKPIQINFDPDGRLWVASSETYPQIAPGEEARDKILILEDKDGDGVSDSTTVFADGLLIPTGVAPGDGGAYVANSTELLYLKDTDGDGKADFKEVVLSGFGTEDTHHILHTFRWGFDSRLYMNQSIYIHSHVETPHGVRRLNAGGIWRFQPETLKLDVFARGWVNTWGHHFDKYGQSFATDGAGGEGINYVVPGAAYPTAYGYARVLHGLNPGSPKHCGLEVIESSHFPDDWRGDLVTHDFRGHRVCRFKVVNNGTGFVSRQQPDVIASSHVAFRPVDVKQGPDGAIYVADWYNPIIQHGEVDFRDPRRDHTHGRIWRITAKGRAALPPKKLSQQSVEELVANLKAPENFTREQSKRILHERGADQVVKVLDKFIAANAGKAEVSEQARLEALWVLVGFDLYRAELVNELLASANFQIRAAAVRALAIMGDVVPKGERLAAFDKAVTDPEPRVRMEGVRGLAELAAGDAANGASAIAVALKAAELPLDEPLDYALWQTVRETQGIWMPKLVAGEFPYDDKIERLIYLTKASESTAPISALAARLKAGGLSAENERKVLELVGSLGQASDLRFVFDVAIGGKRPDGQVAEVLAALASAARQRRFLPEGDLTPISQLLVPTRKEVCLAALGCIGEWKLVGLSQQVLKLVSADGVSAEIEQQAMLTAASLRDLAALEQLKRIGQTGANEQQRLGAVVALAPYETKVSAELATSLLEKTKSTGIASELFGTFLSQKAGADVLAEALAGKTIPEDVAKLGIRAITGSGRTEPKLTEALTKAGKMEAAGKKWTEADVLAVLDRLATEGDPARGETVFRRAELNCQKCHAIGGAGGRVGPDMVSIGSSAQPDYLVYSLVEPNKAVKENYHSLVVSTDDGRVFTGIRVRESDTELVLRDAEDREVSVSKSSIDEQSAGSSLMPAGLVDKLTTNELIDLVRFLSELGKPGPYSVGTAQYARRWVALSPTGDAWTKLYRTSDEEMIRDIPTEGWTSVYSRVDGSLPLDEVPAFRTRDRLAEAARQVAFVRTEVTATTAGVVKLSLGNSKGITWWLDGQPLNVADLLEVPLTEGKHQVTLAINLKERTAPLRLELVPVAGSPAVVSLNSAQ